MPGRPGRVVCGRRGPCSCCAGLYAGGRLGSFCRLGRRRLLSDFGLPALPLGKAGDCFPGLCLLLGRDAGWLASRTHRSRRGLLLTHRNGVLFRRLYFCGGVAALYPLGSHLRKACGGFRAVPSCGAGLSRPRFAWGRALRWRSCHAGLDRFGFERPTCFWRSSCSIGSGLIAGNATCNMFHTCCRLAWGTGASGSR